jgi:hypothetical protein
MMDEHSNEFMTIADIMRATLDEDQFSWATILTTLHIDVVWSEPKFPVSKWAEIIKTVARRRAGRDSEIAVTVLHAFPLEYNHTDVPPHPGRLGAMKRHYQKLFGVKPVQGNDEDEHWMIAYHEGNF